MRSKVRGHRLKREEGVTSSMEGQRTDGESKSEAKSLESPTLSTRKMENPTKKDIIGNSSVVVSYYRELLLDFKRPFYRDGDCTLST